MVEITGFQKRMLTEIYRLKGRQRMLMVDRSPGTTPTVLVVGQKRWGSDRAMDALSDLYSRGLLYQVAHCADSPRLIDEAGTSTRVSVIVRELARPGIGFQFVKEAQSTLPLLLRQMGDVSGSQD